jgi:hypothetical protein
MDPVLEQLRAAVARREFVRVAREAVTAERIHGFVLAASDALLLMQEFRDFTPEGWAVVRLRDVTGARSDANERFAERVLEGEGIRVSSPPSTLELDSWATVFASLLRGEWPLVLVEREDAGDDGDIWVGRLLGAGETAAALRYVNPLGVWDAGVDDIDYDDVTVVRFGDRYTTVLARYTDD